MESYTEGCHPRKALFGGIAFSTKVTLGSFLPRVSYVVKLPNNCVLDLLSVNVFTGSWVVGLNTDRNATRSRCKGVLISDRHILAHSECAIVPTSKGTPANRMFALFDNYSEELYILSRYDFMQLSILAMNTPLDFSKKDLKIRPACLPRSTVQPKEKCSSNFREGFIFCKTENCDLK